MKTEEIKDQEALSILDNIGVGPSFIIEMLKSDSVYTLLRRGVKSPSGSGIDDCEDSYYYDLYDLCLHLRTSLI